jgi:hypothetical protein
MSTYRTYRPGDCVSSGYDIVCGPRRTVIERHTRWQGARTGYRITITGDVRAQVAAAVERGDLDSEISHALDLAPDRRPIHRGQTLRIWGCPARVTQTGYIVQ